MALEHFDLGFLSVYHSVSVSVNVPASVCLTICVDHIPTSRNFVRRQTYDTEIFPLPFLYSVSDVMCIILMEVFFSLVCKYIETFCFRFTKGMFTEKNKKSQSVIQSKGKRKNS